MEKYKENLKFQNILLIIAMVILAVLGGAVAYCEFSGSDILSAATTDDNMQSMWRGFLTGIATGIFAMMLLGLIRNFRAMRDDDLLKKRYIQDHDERTIQIWTSARAVSNQIFIIGGLVAGTVAGFFNMTVSICIFCCILANSLLVFGSKLFFAKKL